MTKEELMRKAIELSKENVENGGGPSVLLSPPKME